MAEPFAKSFTKNEVNHFKEMLAKSDDDTVVQCKTCGRTQYLKFENGLQNGWSKCCGYTMPLIYHEADIDMAVGNIVRRKGF